MRRVAAELTRELKRKRGTQELWPEQGVALYEIKKYGGIAGGIKVSGGKTLISFLAPSVLEHLERPLLLCPSKSIKTGKVAAKYKEARKHWQVRRDITWLSYELLQRKAYVDYLETYQPKLIILDEAHHAGRYKSSRTRHIDRYLAAHPDVVCIVLTGSLIASRVVNDSLRLCYWARRLRTPLPLPNTSTARYWRMALELPARCKPGALKSFCTGDETARQGVGKRYRQTPGIVCSSGKSNIGASLYCETEIVTIKSQQLIDAVGNVRNGRMPDGSELLDPDGSNTWSTVQQLALGFYYVADPPPPLPWLRAYRNWCAYCREVISDENNTCDTESAVADSLDLSSDDCWPWTDWVAVRDSYKRKRKAVWLSNERVLAAQVWMRGHKHGIVWTQFKAFGQRLSPYYGSGARDHVSGRYITEHSRGHACCASIKVCSEDLDLQYLFHENLFVAPPATGAHQEQALARTHRFGQPEGEVTARYWLACTENRNALKIARAREAAAAELDGHMQRKLLIAEWSEDKRKPNKGTLWSGKKIAQALMV